MKTFVKNALKFILWIFIAIMPMIFFLDMAMGIMLVRDYGPLKAFGFIACIVFYSEIMEAYYRRNK